MEHSDQCCSFESCEDCYNRKYSMEAVVRRLEREAHLKNLKARAARLLRYEMVDERRQVKLRKFRERWGINITEAKITMGEMSLMGDNRFGKWRVEKGRESRLRKAWTIVSEEDEFATVDANAGSVKSDRSDNSKR